MVIILLPNPVCTLRLAKPYLYLAHNNYTTEIKMGNEKRKGETEEHDNEIKWRPLKESVVRFVNVNDDA